MECEAAVALPSAEWYTYGLHAADRRGESPGGDAMRKRGGSAGTRGATERHIGDASALGQASRRDFIKAGAAGIAPAGAASGVLSGSDSGALASTASPSRRHMRGPAAIGSCSGQGSFMVGGTLIAAPDGDT